jgi:hypothetical protein
MPVHVKALAPGEKRGIEQQLPGELVLVWTIDSSVSAYFLGRPWSLTARFACLS